MTAAGLIVVLDNKILMVTRRSGKIAIPGGKSEIYEHPLETAIRETYEETGLVCHVPYPGRYYIHPNIDGMSFSAWKAKPIAGYLFSGEGNPFWLELEIFKRIPNVLEYPEWSKVAIEYFEL